MGSNWAYVFFRLRLERVDAGAVLLQLRLDGKSRAGIFGLDNVSEMVNVIRDPW